MSVLAARLAATLRFHHRPLAFATTGALRQHGHQIRGSDAAHVGGLSRTTPYGSHHRLSATPTPRPPDHRMAPYRGRLWRSATDVGGHASPSTRYAPDIDGHRLTPRRHSVNSRLRVGFLSSAPRAPRLSGSGAFF